MGTIINFQADPVSRRLVVNVAPAPRDVSAQILILPVVRIERQSDDNGSGPEQGTTGRRRKRRARS